MRFVRAPVSASPGTFRAPKGARALDIQGWGLGHTPPRFTSEVLLFHGLHEPQSTQVWETMCCGVFLARFILMTPVHKQGSSAPAPQLCEAWVAWPLV